LTSWETYITLLKGYIACGILYGPKAFQNGGWLFSSIIMIFSGVFSAMCSIMLVNVGLKKGNIFSYGVLVERVFGKKARNILDAMIAMTQYSFTVVSGFFICDALKAIFDQVFSIESPIWLYGILICSLITPLTWVRKIKKFSFTFMIGIIMVLTTLTITVGFASKQISTEGVAPGVQAYNKEGASAIIGYSIFAFEGIGIVMPVMQSTAKPEKFGTILLSVIFTVCVLITSFSVVCSISYGENFTQQIVTEMLPADNIIVIIAKLCTVICVVLSYPIIICPTNLILEECTMSGMKQKSCKRTWLKNLSRFIVLASSIIVAICLAEKIDKFLGLLGALLCSTLAFIIPTMLHLKVIAKTRF
jgi:solute carrier family 36 (proton-coupled amino acid transporter)